MSAPTSSVLRSVFHFLVFLCLSVAPRQPYFLNFGSLLPCLVCSPDVVAPSSTVLYACPSFLFFMGSCHYMRLSLLFSPFGFVRCRFGASTNFVCCSFSWIEVPVSLVFVSSCYFLFSSVFRPEVSQRPSLVFLVSFFHT